MTKIKSNNPKITQKELENFERNNDLSLSNEYKNFLLEYNGGYPEPSLFKIRGEQGEYESVLNIFYGVGNMYDNLQKNLEFSDELIEVGFIPIADDPGGNQICLGVIKENYGKVYFWEHELGNANELDNLFFVSEDFTEFLNNLFE